MTIQANRTYIAPEPFIHLPLENKTFGRYRLTDRRTLRADGKV